MSDPSQPKRPEGSQAESPTQAFRLKFDGWMSEMVKGDFDVADGEPPKPATDDLFAELGVTPNRSPVQPAPPASPPLADLAEDLDAEPAPVPWAPPKPR